MGCRWLGIDNQNSIVVHIFPSYVIGGYLNDDVDRNAKCMLLGDQGKRSSLTGVKTCPRHFSLDLFNDRSFP